MLSLQPLPIKIKARARKYIKIDNTPQLIKSGIGFLVVGKNKYPCSFEFQVAPDTSLGVEVTTNPIGLNLTKNKKGGYSLYKQFKIVGNTKDQYSFSAQKVIFNSETLGKNTSYGGIAGNIQTEYKNNNYKKTKPYLVEYAISNFIFTGLTSNAYSVKNKVQIRRDSFSVTIDKYTFTFTLVNYYTEQVEAISYSNQSRITSTVKVKIDNLGEINVVNEYVNYLCEMLSIIQGNSINCVYWNLYDAKNKIIKAHYSNGVRRNASNYQEIIDNFSVPGGLKIFLEKTYHNYVSKRVSLNLNKFKVISDI